MVEAIRFQTVHLPSICHHCGHKLNKKSVNWTGALTAICNKCGAKITATMKSTRI